MKNVVTAMVLSFSLILSGCLEGPTGSRGDKGAAGLNGLSGTDGKDGLDGKDATQIADGSMPVAKLQVTATDNGKILVVENGVAKLKELNIPSTLKVVAINSNNEIVAEAIPGTSYWTIQDDFIINGTPQENGAPAGQVPLVTQQQALEAGFCYFESVDCLGTCHVGSAYTTMLAPLRSIFRGSVNKYYKLTGAEVVTHSILNANSVFMGNACFNMLSTLDRFVIPSEVTNPLAGKTTGLRFEVRR